jgi:cobalt-precorrin-5B (C1)-methyltransferase
MKKLPLKKGFTTGSAAAASAKAALIYKLTGEKLNKIMLKLPFNTLDIDVHFDNTTPFVIKNSGDDPDITNNAKIYTKLEITDGFGEIFITGGLGVGIVTKKGLQVPVGSYAINPKPQKIIRNNIIDILPKNKSLLISIGIVDGEILAKKTFNERLGIIGGLSVLGTTGIITPMSLDAIKSTIEAQINVLIAEGTNFLYLVPGKIGENFIQDNFKNAKTIVVSNYFDYAIAYLTKLGISNFALGGHPGKLAKIAMGYYNTHSKSSPQANRYIADKLKLPSSFNTVEEIINSGINFNIIARDISERILKDYGLSVPIYLCNMKGKLIGSYEP